MKKICVITGSRADYGPLRPLLTALKNSDEMQLQLIVTGSHLAPEFGSTCQEIEDDDFEIDEKVEMLLSSDSAVGMSKSLGLGAISFAECYERLKPDMVVVQGDRYELISAVSTALITKIPIAHLGGGDITTAAFDDAFRHAVSKMSHLHFTGTEASRQRLIQMGEHPERVLACGELGLDNIRELELLEKDALEKDIGFAFGKRNLMVTFHPATLDSQPAEAQVKELLDALSALDDVRFIITKANADSGGRSVNKLLEDFANERKGEVLLTSSLGYLRYLSALQFVDGMIGNSSSGLVEAPSFKIPTVNIGARQEGRPMAESVINCDVTSKAITVALNTLFSDDFKGKLSTVVNPYGDGKSAIRIVKALADTDFESLLRKGFYVG